MFLGHPVVVSDFVDGNPLDFLHLVLFGVFGGELDSASVFDEAGEAGQHGLVVTAGVAVNLSKGEDETIRRAAKWLRKAFTSKIVGDYGSPSKFVSAFKEAMKEETK